MPNAAILFSVIIMSVAISNAYAFVSSDLVILNDDKDNTTMNSLNFDSGIVDVDSAFFTENNFKRYLIFGDGLKNLDSLKNNSIYNIQSSSGFFPYLFYLKNQHLILQLKAIM